MTRIISQRLNAIRKLQDNPNDCEATKLFDDTEKNVFAIISILKPTLILFKILDVSLGYEQIYSRSIPGKYRG